MNDITALTQAEINDALAQLKQLSEYPTPSTQYARVLRKYISSLVEALEKARRTNDYLREQSAEWERKAISNFQECATMSERIFMLESRTVTVKLAEDITAGSAPEVFEIAAEAERLGLRGTYASYAVGWNARGKADKETLAAAGIQVIEGDA